MSELVEEIIRGRKTIFIAPDRTVFPQEYLEEYLLHGYECYFIDKDVFLPLEQKVEIILQVFKEAILFFNIDAPTSEDLSWPSIIKAFKDKYPDALFGVLYTKRQSPTEKQALERQYLYSIGIQGGCIQLEYQKRNNFNLIAQVLYANQANGRRKNVRAVCKDNCSIAFNVNGQGVFASKLADISMSHFSFVVPFGKLHIEDYEKVSDVSFTVHGMRFKSDAVLYMTREVEGGTLYVFAFQGHDGKTGLDSVNRQLLLPKIYEIMNDNCSELLSKLFRTASRTKSMELEAVD